MCEKRVGEKKTILLPTNFRIGMANELSWRERAQALLDSKAKPPGSLGTLEEWAVTLCAAQRTLEPVAAPASLIVFAADHGTSAIALPPPPGPRFGSCWIIDGAWCATFCLQVSRRQNLRSRPFRSL